ncbi:16S rRNA (guanine(527)-N(7))-methyltransferase RsmG [Litoreibacter arenae]|uniref:16S rRNA (guanine(527)-N(7))-methyltransferase RsmG n=1 Tax=Litoreibacter arenae TaxID=491388 RepID=UPI0005948C87|nr:16S rRNA (guanine(527)-N(7))-methyltransferase RsmG [Litoreibacter arenae]
MTDQEQFADRFSVSRETIDRLSHYETLLVKWTSKINLIAKSTVPEIWSRHFVDSAQVFEAVPADAQKLCDLGSGGGFPGLVIAALAKEKAPNLNVTLVESDLRKASFLMAAAREMDLDVNILAERVEQLSPQAADVVTARALAPLVALMSMADLHLKKGGTALFLKGERYQQELDTAAEMWDFNYEKRLSMTSDESALIIITKLRRAA